MTDRASADLSVGLEKIKRRRRVVWLVFFGYLPFMMLVAAAKPAERFVISAALAYMVFFAVVIARLGLSKCPRCGKHFHYTWFWHNPWTSRCLHCGLKLRGDAHA
jgi:hypothetical protein